MALPKEPRQKMINLMYLVLTALLALNVSSEILNAFKTVNNSLMNANGIIEAKNEGIFKSFEAKTERSKNCNISCRFGSLKPIRQKSMQIICMHYIESLKVELMKAGRSNYTRRSLQRR